jgi:hypothetical protein
MDTRKFHIKGICIECRRVDNLWIVKMNDEENQNYMVFVEDYDLHCDLVVGERFYAWGERANNIQRDGSLVVYAEHMERWGRYCSHCGKWHEEGYYSEHTGDYACSKECLSELFLQEDIEEQMEDDSLFWADWSIN